MTTNGCERFCSHKLHSFCLVTIVSVLNVNNFLVLVACSRDCIRLFHDPVLENSFQSLLLPASTVVSSLSTMALRDLDNQSTNKLFRIVYVGVGCEDGTFLLYRGTCRSCDGSLEMNAQAIICHQLYLTKLHCIFIFEEELGRSIAAEDEECQVAVATQNGNIGIWRVRRRPSGDSEPNITCDSIDCFKFNLGRGICTRLNVHRQRRRSLLISGFSDGMLCVWDLKVFQLDRLNNCQSYES